MDRPKDRRARALRAGWVVHEILVGSWLYLRWRFNYARQLIDPIKLNLRSLLIELHGLHCKGRQGYSLRAHQAKDLLAMVERALKLSPARGQNLQALLRVQQVD